MVILPLRVYIEDQYFQPFSCLVHYNEHSYNGNDDGNDNDKKTYHLIE